MAELHKYKRLIFKHPRTQRLFISKVKSKSGLSWIALANILKVNPRTLADWYREKFRMTLVDARKMSELSNTSIPSYKIFNFKDHLRSISIKGGLGLVKKQGSVSIDEDYRNEQWREWWMSKGKINSKITKPLPFHTPNHSEELAEFFGVMIGDGGMSKMQICVTLHHIDDLEYSKYIVRLVKRLFKVKPSVYHSNRESVNNVVISRIGLVKYLFSLGLPIGNKIKQGVDIPQWIKENKKYKVACLRGLIDTDGSIFVHSYKVSNRKYSYKKLCFSTASGQLRNSVYKILKELRLNPRISGGTNILLESKKDIENYFRLVGSHNPKHLNRYAKISYSRV